MKKMILISALIVIALVNTNTHATTFEFYRDTNLPPVIVKIRMQNGMTGSTTLNVPDPKNPILVEPTIKIESRERNVGKQAPIVKETTRYARTEESEKGNEIAELDITTQCGNYCDEVDEIYVASPKPADSLSTETKKSNESRYVEKIRRYNQPELMGKTRFTISKSGWGAKSFFKVEPKQVKPSQEKPLE
jgi:hypothetical protein